MTGISDRFTLLGILHCNIKLNVLFTELSLIQYTDRLDRCYHLLYSTVTCIIKHSVWKTVIRSILFQLYLFCLSILLLTQNRRAVCNSQGQVHSSDVYLKCIFFPLSLSLVVMNNIYVLFTIHHLYTPVDKQKNNNIYQCQSFIELINQLTDSMAKC